MSCRFSDYPWFFRRDEFDVLEDEYDEVLRRHEDGGGSRATRLMEEEVIKEQDESEERVEHELDRLLGPAEDEEEVDDDGCCGHPECHESLLDDPRSLRQILAEESERDPLYRRAFRWASRLFDWSGRAWLATGEKDRDLFRLRANAWLVPAKISFAGSELEEDDPRARPVAEKEFELAQLYLSRCLESLERLAARRPSVPEEFLIEGRTLVEEIFKAKKSVARK